MRLSPMTMDRSFQYELWDWIRSEKWREPLEIWRIVTVGLGWYFWIINYYRWFNFVLLYLCHTWHSPHIEISLPCSVLSLSGVLSFYSPRFTTDYYTNYMYLLKKKNYLALLVDITFFFLIITIPIFYL